MVELRHKSVRDVHHIVDTTSRNCLPLDSFIREKNTYLAEAMVILCLSYKELKVTATCWSVLTALRKSIDFLNMVYKAMYALAF